VSFKEALQPDFKDYARQIIKNAEMLGEILKKEGATLISDGTDNHIVLLDVRPWNLTGKEAEKSLEKAGITVNKNTIPYDPESPFVTSGIRMGTAALTTRGMKQEEMIKIGKTIAAVLRSKGDPIILKQAKETIRKICEGYPLFQQSVTV
jgi:glycine hydroxymethyltransferase